jgi:hypothetical protein
MGVEERVLELLEAAAQRLQVQPPRLDDYGTGGIDLEDGFRLSIVAPPFVGFIYVAAPICMLGRPDDRSVTRRALEMNYMVTQTRGATLAIDPDANQLLLCTRLRLETLTAELLAEELSSIDAASRSIRERLLDSPEAEPADVKLSAPGYLSV